MKRFLKILLCAVICVLAVSISVCAEAPEFSLNLGRDDYRYFKKGDNLKKAAEITGMTEKELSELFERENLLMLVLSEDNARQIKVSYYQNELSKKIGNLAAMETEDVRELAKELYEASDSKYIDVTSIDHDKYMCFSELLKDSGGDYIAAQYITVVDGYFWHITTYGPPHDNVAVILPYLTIGSDGRSVASTVLHIVSLGFGALAIVMLVLYIVERRKERKTVQTETDVELSDSDTQAQE